MSFSERRKSAPRVKFERPLGVRAMAIDGTWSRECFLLDMSETGARIELKGPAAGLTEFFLLMTTFGNPVFRRCTREWVDGELIGVTFQTGRSDKKSLKVLRREAELI
jgi:hypothetical protein